MESPSIRIYLHLTTSISSTIQANCTFEIFSLCYSSSLWRAYFIFLLARVSFCVCLLYLKPFAGWKALVLNARCACHTEVTRGIQIVYWIESGQEVRIKRIDCIRPSYLMHESNEQSTIPSYAIISIKLAPNVMHRCKLGVFLFAIVFEWHGIAWNGTYQMISSIFEEKTQIIRKQKAN